MRSLATLTTVIVVLVAASSFAVPVELAHQGRLTSSDGTPVNGTVDLTFRIFDVSTGGGVIWEEVDQITVQDGLFSVMLGQNTPLDFSAISIRPDSLWLEIQVGGDPPLTPRTRIAATPVSAVSTSVNGDIETSDGEAVVNYHDLDDDDDGISMRDTPDSAGISVRESDGAGNANVLLGTTYQPGQPLYGQILFERVRSGSDPDTSYILQDRAKVTDEKFHVTETFGPSPGTRRTSQGADTGKAYVETSVFDSFDSTQALIQSSPGSSVVRARCAPGTYRLKPNSSLSSMLPPCSWRTRVPGERSNCALRTTVSSTI